jgi:DNA-binding beta-propeller fold protein YncE
MIKRTVTIMSAAIVAIVMFLLGSRLLPVQGRAKPGGGFAAVPEERGGQDDYGPYEVVADWPKPLSQLPGHEKWTWGTVNAVFAESPNRIFIGQRGELPLLRRPVNTPLPQFGPSLSFPVSQLPFRNAGQGPVASPPGPEGQGSDGEGGGRWQGRYGVDARWEHILNVIDANGKIVESWTQWDKMFKRVHAIYINPYDPEKNVWVVDDFRDVLFKFSNDGKKLLQTIGTQDKEGDDEQHFGGPNCLAWLPDSTMFVADGSHNGRVVKFDKDGKYLMAWGQKGNPPNDTRPAYMNDVHGIAVDPVTRRVYVVDRKNRRIQVFDENGKFLDQWSTGEIPSELLFMYMSADRHIWVSDAFMAKFIEYDLGGHLLYTWGTFGDWPGAIFGPHSISVDQEGNFYVAETLNGRVQKFRPRKDANPDFLVGVPVRSAWK